jgi:integrase
MPKYSNTDIKKYQTKKGERWRFRIYLGISERTGKKIELTRCGFLSYSEAQEAYNKLRANGIRDLVNNDSTFKDIFEFWFKAYKLTVKESTVHHVRQIYNRHLREQLGHFQIKKMRPAMLQDYFLNMSQEIGTYRVIANYTKRVLQYAVSLGLLEKNPMNNLIFPKGTTKNNRDSSNNFYNYNELLEFLKYAKQTKPRNYVYFSILAFTGLRRSEALALTWDDIDLEKKTLEVNKTLAVGAGGRIIVNAPKTQASQRVMVLTDSLCDLLAEYKTTRRSNKLFSTLTGDKYLNLNSPRQWLQKVYEMTPDGFKHITLHGFRHTFASLLYEQDRRITPKDVQAALGHAKIDIAMNIYTHQLKSGKDRVAKALNNLNPQKTHRKYTE